MCGVSRPIKRCLTGLLGGDNFLFFECLAPACPSPLVIRVMPLGGIGTGINTFPGSGWPTELVRAGAVDRDTTEDVGMTMICESAEHKIELELSVSGTTAPEEVTGTTAGKPSFSEFGAGSGDLASSEGPVEVIGKLKVMGFDEEEVITTK